MINSSRVSEIVKDSLFEEKDLATTAGEIPKDAVIAEGIMGKFGFHPKRLESHRDEVVAMLQELPDEFKASTGRGGWSFLNMCNDKSGDQWTGEHRVMDELLTLGVGLKIVEFCAPRDMWELLPGGMPYVVFNL